MKLLSAAFSTRFRLKLQLGGKSYLTIGDGGMLPQKLVASVAIVSMLTMTLPGGPALAQAFHEREAVPLFGTHGIHANASGRRGVAGAVRFRMPLDGDFRRNLEQTRFALSFEHMASDSRSDSVIFGKPQPIMEFSMRLDDHESIAFNGIEFREFKAMYAEAEEDEGGLGLWWIPIGFVGLVVAITVGTVAVNGGDLDFFGKEEGT